MRGRLLALRPLGALAPIVAATATASPFLARQREREDGYLAQLSNRLPGLPVQEFQLQADEVVGIEAVRRFAALL